MEKTWMPTVAGILTLMIGGAGGILICFLSLLFVGMAQDSLGPLRGMLIIGTEIVIIYLSIAGGFAATGRKKRRLALAGTISAFLVAATTLFYLISCTVSVHDYLVQTNQVDSFMALPIAITSLGLLGATASIILVVHSKKEFK